MAITSESVTSDQLLARVKARAQVPSTEGRLSDDEIYVLIDDVIRSSVGREIYDADDGRWVKTAPDVAITTGIAGYRIPYRALSSGVDEVLLVDSSGNAEQLDYVDRSDVWEWGTQTGVPCAYSIVGDVITLLPTPTSGYALRVRYVRRPNALTAVANCAVLATVTSATDVTYSSVPASGWTNGTVHVVDVVERVGNVESLEDDVSVTVVTASTKLVRGSGAWVTTGPYAIQVGAFACPFGTSCVVQVPDVAIPYVADLAARDVCVALGDQAGADLAARLAEQRRTEMVDAISERSRIRPKVVPRNSPLRVASQRGTRWRRWP